MKTLSQFMEEKEVLVINPLPYSKTDLQPTLSKETLNYHYEHLAKAYADRFNSKEGDLKFNKAGVYLHNIYFQQFYPSRSNNNPIGKIKLLIDSKYEHFDNLKNEIEKVAMAIQGSGWVYLDIFGNIKTIVNHDIVPDIAILIDWWEHAWALDYKQNKKKYLERIWNIINWSIINDRLEHKK